MLVEEEEEEEEVDAAGTPDAEMAEGEEDDAERLGGEDDDDSAVADIDMQVNIDEVRVYDEGAHSGFVRQHKQADDQIDMLVDDKQEGKCFQYNIMHDAHNNF